MIMLSPKLYLWEIDPTPLEEIMFLECGCEFFVDLKAFAEQKKLLILENWQIHDEHSLCAYRIDKDRNFWVCDRGMVNQIHPARWANLLHFILCFEL